MSDLISLVVPIYNMESCLQRCIDSIVNQTYRNIEVILINDGSDDGTKDICDFNARNDDRISVYHKENEGVSVARNLGISKAKGEYIAFVDPDDCLTLDFAETLIEIAVKNNSDIVSCCARIETEEGCVKNEFFKNCGDSVARISKERVITQLISNRHYCDAGRFIDIGVPWGKLYKRDFIIENNLKFNPSLRRNQDNIFNLYAFQLADAFDYIDRPMYCYTYDNITKVFRKYVGDADVLFRNLTKETSDFLELYGYKNNKVIYDLYLEKVLLFLMTALKTKLCNPSYDINLRERIAEIKNYCEDYPFNSLLLESDKNAFSIKNSIAINLLEFKMYWLMYVIYILKEAITLHLEPKKFLSIYRKAIGRI